ncbi:hypothetical protein [Turicibacter sanguinis]|uniref:hypothetical protein n=1 Tax=Turicibacter sanguinis TaxID=154288 RepID=UPI002943949F|nr:hypothetical protein [Turicibacter sanguinis]
MKLEEMGKLSIGLTLSRIEAKPGEAFQGFELFTMQELSKETGNNDVKIQSQFIKVSEKRLKDLTLSKQGMVVIGLTSYKAFVITKAYENRVIPSNFAYLQCDEGIDPDYVAWYFNEHPQIQKQLTLAMQGSIIRALSVQMLRELKIEVPPLALQQKLGSIYRLKSQRQKLLIEKRKLEEKVMNHLMIQYLKEDI